MSRMMVLVLSLLLFGTGLSLAQGETELEATTETKSTTVAVTVEAIICSSVFERMPVDTVAVFAAGTEKVYAWCQVSGAVDSVSVWLNWYYKGELKAEVELPVKSSSWRTYSSKNLLKHWTGDWEVRVLDADKNILKSVTFVVGQ